MFPKQLSGGDVVLQKPVIVVIVELAAVLAEEHLARAFKRGLYGDPPAYYDQNLVLFAQGFTESRYRFGADGSLAPAWETRCIGRAR